MMKFSLKDVRLDLKKTWKISRESSEFKINYIVAAEMDGAKGLGEAAISARYSQSPESIKEGFKNFLNAKLIFNNLEDLEKLNSLNLDMPLRFAIESAIIHLWANIKGQNVSEYLGLKPVSSLATSYSIPIMEISEIKDYLKVNPYPSYKLKIDDKVGSELIIEVLKNSSAKVRIDANEGFNSIDSFLKFLSVVDMTRVEFIEQPFPANLKDLYKDLFKLAPCKIMADESFRDERDLGDMKDHFHMVNLKLMKVGSYLKTISLAKELKKLDMELMIGCMIESSVGIQSAMNLASLFDCYDLDGSLLVKNDPYHLIENNFGRLTFKH